MKNKDKTTIYLVIIFLIFIVYNIFGHFYTAPQVIHKDFKGIKYQAGKPDVSESVSIKIDGVYTKKLWGFQKNDTFEGSIIIDGQPFFRDYPSAYNTYPFNSEPLSSIKMSGIECEDFIGSVYVYKMMDKIVITIGEPSGDNYVFSPASGKYIAGPANDRNQAVNITNSLLQTAFPRPVE